MARYTQLEMADIQEIGRRYNLGVSGFSPILGGANNSSYRLQTCQGDHVLTVFDAKSCDAVLGLSKLLQRLAESAFPTTRLRPQPKALTLPYIRANLCC